MADVSQRDKQERAARAAARSLRRQLDAGRDVIRAPGRRLLTRREAWPLLRSLELALDVGGTFHPPTCDENGDWWAHLTIPLGRYDE